MPHSMEVGFSPGDFVLDGDPVSHPQKGGGARKFSTRVYCGQTVGWMKMPLGTKIGLSPGDSVLDGDPAPSPQRGWSSLPNFRPISIVAKRLDAGCIKMPLGMEVGLSSEDFVFDGDPDPLPKRGRNPPIFDSCLLRSNGCMDQDATWYGCRSRPRRHCVRWGPSSPPRKKGHNPNFWPMSIVAKQLDGSRCHFVRR